MNLERRSDTINPASTRAGRPSPIGLAGKAAIVFAVTATLVAASPSGAHAQEVDGGQVALGFLLMGVSTGAGVVSGYSTWGRSDNSKSAALDAKYMREHYIAIQQDLTLGRGLTVVELASAVGVGEANVAAFGAILRQNRRRLLALIEPPLVTEERVELFITEVTVLGDSARTTPPSKTKREMVVAATY